VTTPLHQYLAELWAIRSTGLATDETAYYPALTNLLNEIGRHLKPKVFCQSQLKRSEAGQPDFGLFSQTQLRGSWDEDAPRLPPDRGVVEAKGTAASVELIARSEQVTRYWESYGLVLVTNLREFLLVGRDQFGRRTRLEQFSLSTDETDFWQLARSNRPRKELAERFEQFVRRMLLHRATLTQPKDVAWFLASYARDSLARIESGGGAETASLERVRETLEEALGIHFEGEKGEHFFRSTLVQTLFYGLFSAWVLWCRKNEDPEVRKGFNSQSAAWHLKLPVLRALFEEVNRPGTLNPLRLGEVMEWAANTLCRVDDRAFFTQFKEEQAVQYFYEPFLEAFDPTLRKALGVWYTPHEVVEYMVERVDRVLRSELDIADGLADPRVLILDPCCGTGSYLVEVLKRIERTLREKGDDALVSRDVKTAAMERVFGFELMPAPFVVAHLQVGLLMDRLGVPFNTEIVHTRDRLERAAIYLTNALTGWGDRDETHYLPLPELHDEMDRARSVKREQPILVVLGNPPYNAFAGVSPREEGELVKPYKDGLVKTWKIKKFNLDDLYVRFFRIAERRITEQTGRGVICYISNLLLPF
jgi:SAM-dependent methyltransferase